MTTYTATITRQVLFIDESKRGPVCGGIYKPAGTAVYARPLGTPGLWRVRVPGTLLTQDVRSGVLNLTQQR